MWEAIDEVTRREGQTIHEICALVDRYRGDSSLTAALRVFIVSYFRAAATEDGHEMAGHGRTPSAILVSSSGIADQP